MLSNNHQNRYVYAVGKDGIPVIRLRYLVHAQLAIAVLKYLKPEHHWTILSINFDENLTIEIIDITHWDMHPEKL